MRQIDPSSENVMLIYILYTQDCRVKARPLPGTGLVRQAIGSWDIAARKVLQEHV